MKKILQHIGLSVLSFCFLFSTMSFSINTHHCGNILVDKQMMLPAKKCAMHSANQGHTNVKDDCCNESNQIIEGQDELQLNFLEDIQSPFVALSYSADHFLLRLQTDQLKRQTHFKDRAPPGNKYSFQILYQSFLI